MKKWQVEQILYLNTGYRNKLVFAEPRKDAHQLTAVGFKKENVVLVVARRVFHFFLRVF